MTIWLSPTGHIDHGGWTDELKAYDEDQETLATGSVGGNAWTNFLEFSLDAPLSIGSIRFDAYYYYNRITKADLDAYYDDGGGAAWHDVFQGGFTHHTWVEKALPGGPWMCERFRIRFFNTYTYTHHADLWEVDFGYVPTVPTIETLDATNIATDGADLKTKVTDDMGKTISVRHNYGKTTAYGMNTPWQEGKHTNDIVIQTVTDLDPETTYHFRGEAFFED